MNIAIRYGLMGFVVQTSVWKIFFIIICIISLLLASLCYFLIILPVFYNILFMYVFFLYIYLLFYVFCVFVLFLCIVSLLCCLFRFLYNFTDHCHRVGTHLQSINIVSPARTWSEAHSRRIHT